MDLEERVRKIEERNARVEVAKAWETSWTRRFLIIVLTYIVVAVTLTIIGVSRPWVNAIIPAIGFTLSTLSIPYFKNLWLKHRK